MPDHPEMRTIRLQAPQDVRRLVGAAIVDIDDLEGTDTGQRRLNLTDQRRDVLGFVQNRHDDGQQGRRIGACLGTGNT